MQRRNSATARSSSFDWNAQARLLGTELAQKEWDKRAGIATQRRDCERALTVHSRAAWKLARTEPTTPAGAGALLAYVKEIMSETGDMDWHPIALDTLVRALASMAPPTPSLPAAAATVLATRRKAA
jgi:hypothetical protein